MPEPSDMIVVKQFFMPEAKASEASRELRELSPDERTQLAQGIRDGSYTYA